MSFDLPSLEDLREQNRDFVTARLGAGPMIPNSVLRVMSDANAGLAFLTILYLQWLSEQFLPDTADAEWLDRHARLWIGGRKSATYAVGTVNVTGIDGSVIPSGAILVGSTAAGSMTFEVTEVANIGPGGGVVSLAAQTPGAAGNLAIGSALSFASAPAGVDGTAVAIAFTGGADAESDDQLRSRVLQRIRQPPMGGDAEDYVAWALEVPGVSRAWASPLEMGPGTVTIRFMCDDLRGTSDARTSGFPLDEDIEAVRAHLDTKRPVCVKDFFVVAPVPEPIGFAIVSLDKDTTSTRAAIAASVSAMLADRAAPARALNGVAQPAQTIFAAWLNKAILDTADVSSFDLVADDFVMPNAGAIAVLGDISYG